MNIQKTAMITVCGRPNVGKSSLTNALVGEKIAIVSNKAQTTRNRIYGVVNREDTQFILLDTPGLHRPKSALGDYMVKVVTASLSDVDCALLLVEPIPHVGGPEKALIDRVREEALYLQKFQVGFHAVLKALHLGSDLAVSLRRNPIALMLAFYPLKRPAAFLSLHPALIVEELNNLPYVGLKVLFRFQPYVNFHLLVIRHDLYLSFFCLAFFAALLVSFLLATS